MSFLQILVLVITPIANAAVPALASCSTDLAATCNALHCYAWRGPTDCVNVVGFLWGFYRCVCKHNYCASDDGRMCEPAPFTFTQSYKLDEDVEVKDQGGVWMSGKVTSVQPQEVQPDGWSKSFSWGKIRGKDWGKIFNISERVQVREKEGDIWQTGIVTSNAPLMVKSKFDESSFSWTMVLPKDPKVRAAFLAKEENQRTLALQHFDTDAKRKNDEATHAVSEYKHATVVLSNLRDLSVTMKQAAEKAAAMSKAAEASVAEKVSASATAKMAVQKASVQEKAAEKKHTQILQDKDRKDAKQKQASLTLKTLKILKQEFADSKDMILEAQTAARSAAMQAEAERQLSDEQIAMVNVKETHLVLTRADEASAMEAAQVATAKNNAAQEAWAQKTEVRLDAVLNYGCLPLIIWLLAAVVLVTATVSWQRAHVGGPIVMPEGLLG